MNISRFATAAITAALLLLCPSGAASSEDDTTDERPVPQERYDDQAEQKYERQDFQRTERQPDGGEIPTVVDQERPAMPIPIPGVGRDDPDEAIDS